jgi:ribosomal 50S subunit-associated protein YjgA (DUF615 family)
MEDVEQARSVVEQEVEAVLRGLRDLRRRYRRITKTLMTLDEERQALMVRGRAAGLPTTELANAAGTSRQSVTTIIRQAQEERQDLESWERRRRRSSRQS